MMIRHFARFVMFFALVLVSIPAFSMGGCEGSDAVTGAPAASVCGQAVDDQNEPIANAPLLLKNKDSDKAITVFTDDQGFFRAYNLDSGEYSIELPEGLAKEFSVAPSDEALPASSVASRRDKKTIEIKEKSFFQNMLSLQPDAVDAGKIQLEVEPNLQR
ncbi:MULTISPECIES: carboxypeptidase-like regulatory domain-containing protein [Pseudovibrio]|nr:MULTISPECIES: carboxypeptidase-like regulatory domain-containing protein [Pseudovibrio]